MQKARDKIEKSGQSLDIQGITAYTISMNIAIIIPARWGSTRFPGKPLVKIAGKTMLERVVERARDVAKTNPEIDIMVATEDNRIQEFCAQIDVRCILTSEDCLTGSDRVLEAAQKSGKNYDFVLGLQGDAPFTPLDALTKMIAAFKENPALEVVTPVVQMSWAALDNLRESKKTTPFSGTTAIIDGSGRALWFSKNILPGIRKEDKLREDSSEFSPVFQHIGLYGFRFNILEKFVSLPQGHYEVLEGLEQLRLLENGITIQTVSVTIDHQELQGGIDSPEDVTRVEEILARIETEHAA